MYIIKIAVLLSQYLKQKLQLLEYNSSLHILPHPSFIVSDYTFILRTELDNNFDGYLLRKNCSTQRH